MPINAGPEYFAAERRYQEAKTNEDKLRYLNEMLRTAPHHKGSEKLLAEITGKIKKVKEQMEKAEAQRKKAASGRSISVKKDGIGQIVLVGAPNSGKSTLLKTLTNADVEIASHAFTTKKPEIGMIEYKKANIQLVEVPAIVQGSSTGKAQGRELLSIVRTSDAIVFVLDSMNALGEFNLLKRELNNAFIVLNKSKPKARVERSEFKGITISGKKYLKISLEQLRQFLRGHGLYHASIVLEEPVGLPELEEVLNVKLVYKKALAVVVEKYCDLSREMEKELSKQIPVIKVKELSHNVWEPTPKSVGLRNNIVDVSKKNIKPLTEVNGFRKPDVMSDEKLKELKERFFELLNVILVYTKKPRDDAAEKPLALRKGATVEDCAKNIHKDFAGLKYARVWGSTKYGGQRVTKEYKLQNGDIIEISA